MNEADWLTEEDLEYLLDLFEEKASRRKLRLFAVGCVRNILHLIPDQTCQRAVELAEQYADGRTTAESLRELHVAAENQRNAAWRDSVRVEREGRVYFATKQDAVACDLPGVATAITKEEFDEVSARNTIDAIACVLAHSAISPDQWGTSAGDDAAMRAVECERLRQLHLFRDVFGNPFRPIRVNPAWLAWNDGTLRTMAQIIYDERRFNDLPILADALEDAGCTNPDILAHCRQPGEHVRGCWLVDHLLDKK